MKRRLCSFLAVLLALLLPLAVAAQDKDEAGLHILRSVMHAEQDTPELCLEVDHPLTTLDHLKAAASLRLEEDGHTITLSQKALTLANSELCIPGLKHRKDYHVTVTSLRAASGEKLATPYTLSFTVPERQPALVFVNNARNNGVTPWQTDGPVLRSINVTTVKLEIFRITDPARMSEAWSNRLQTTLAPSESATFAHTNGTLSWQGAMNFESAPDEIQEQSTPLTGEAAKLPPGLYLIIASAPELRQKETDLAPIAATWLLRSNLSLQAMRDGSTFYATVEQQNQPSTNVHLSITSKAQQTLIEGQSGDDGVASLKIADNKIGDANTLMALTTTGDAAFLDITKDAPDAPVLPVDEATLTLAQPTATPGENISVLLTAHDIHGNTLNTKGSQLQLLRPDGSFYANLTVPDTLGGEGTVAFAAPVTEGIWSLIWRRADGSNLAETKLRVSTSPDAPHLELTTDTPLLDESGEANFTVKSFATSGAPVPFVSGKILVSWGAPDHVFGNFPDYKFGVANGDAGKPSTVASYITDASGTAHLHLKLTVPANRDASLTAALLRATGDAATGALDTVDLVVPLRPKNIAVGIRPQEPGAHFPEDSLARFDVLILDSSGKRSDSDDLNYQIFEEGRSFDWYQAQGYWQYKPLEQQRRVDGGEVEKGPDGRRHVEWPVATGTYQLFITDGDDNRVAEIDFTAGYGTVKQDTQAPSRLSLSASPEVLQAGHDEYIRFTLPKPAVVTAVVADDHVRKLIRATMPAGENQIIFTPQPEWGGRLRVNITAVGGDASAPTSSEGDVIVASTGDAKSSANDVRSVAPIWPSVPDYDGDVARLAVVIQQDVDSNRNVSIAGNTDTKNFRSVIASAQPLYNLPALLSDLFQHAPETTHEIIAVLDSMRLWRDVIIGTHLMSDAGFEHRRVTLLTRLLMRQMPDGGFTAAPGSPVDMASTATAAAYLSQVRDSLTKAATDQAIGWLHRELENTWFEEKDRPSRAAAYAALAAADALDVASLRFYGNSSPDKLPPVAAAQLALAFAHIDDQGSANYWLGATHVDATAAIDPELLGRLASNNFYPVENVRSELAKQADSKNFTLLADASLLRAIWKLDSRSEGLHATFNGAEKNTNVAETVAMPDRGASLDIHNNTNHALYLMEVEAAADAAHPAITRHIYRPDGGEMTGNLHVGETYLVVLEGSWLGSEKGPVYIHDDIGPGLQPTSCPLSGPGSDGFLAWMPELTPVTSCDSAANALDIVLQHPADSGNWRTAYMARAVALGSFSLDRPIASQAVDGARIRGNTDRITVR